MDAYYWVFYKKGDLYIHSSVSLSDSSVNKLCEFRSGIPEYHNLFLGISEGKLNAYTLNYLSLDFHNPIPSVKIQLMRTIRNILAFPFEKPKYIVFTTSQNESNVEKFSLNLMDIKSQSLLNSITFEETHKILKIKTLELNINGKMVNKSLFVMIFVASTHFIPDVY